MPPRFYLAAPFFNPPQLEIVQEVEDILSRNGIDFFSPRLQHPEGKPVPITTPESAQAIFQENVKGILSCQLVLAVLDYALPPMRELQVVDRLGTHQPIPVKIPDTGTVWEMGYAFGNLVPVIGYFARETPKRANIMLLRSCVGLVVGAPRLELMADHLRVGKPSAELQNAGVFANWEGGYV